MFAVPVRGCSIAELDGACAPGPGCSAAGSVPDAVAGRWPAPPSWPQSCRRRAPSTASVSGCSLRCTALHARGGLRTKSMLFVGRRTPRGDQIQCSVCAPLEEHGDGRACRALKHAHGPDAHHARAPAALQTRHPPPPAALRLWRAPFSTLGWPAGLRET
jgi:hypothetical protein